MKKLLLIALLSLIYSGVYSQYFKLTPNNFVNAKEEKNDYVIIDVPNTPQSELFKKAKKYLNTLYNNPDFVTSEVENEQIVIDAIDAEYITTMLSFSESNLWKLSYKYILSFKDNRIKFTPYFKKLINPEFKTFDLIGASILGSTTGLYNNKGKCLKPKGVEQIEKRIDIFIDGLEQAMNKKKTDDNW